MAYLFEQLLRGPFELYSDEPLVLTVYVGPFVLPTGTPLPQLPSASVFKT